MSAEPAKTTPATARMLVVGAADDADVASFSQACASAGWQLDHVSDVYLAMSRLALGPSEYSRVVVDARCLDRAEREFLDLAPRYVSHVRLDELTDFVRRGDAPDALNNPEPIRTSESAPPPAHSDSSWSDAAMPLPALHDLDVENVIPGRWEPVFSGGSNGSNPAGDEIEEADAPTWHGAADSEEETVPHLSLHDAVRRRMWAGAGEEGAATKPPQRIPPGTRREMVQPAAPPPTATPASAAQGKAALTREELRALLGDESPGGKGGAA